MTAVTSENRRSQTATAEMTIRDALESDLPAIIDIYNATVPTRMVTAELEPTTVEARLPWFREHSPDQHPFWVAEFDGRVVGWLDFKKFLPRCAYRGTAEISVYVDEKFRRRGVAHRLLEESIARSPSLGITAIVGLIFGHNQPSLKLFERLGFQRWGLLPGIARLDGLGRDLVVMGRHCPAQATRPALHASGFAAKNSQFNECLNLMHALMQYRQEPIHSQLLKIRDKYSMLHLDVLILIYHFAKVCSGPIVEIGAFLGGATIAAAFGVRDSGKRKTLIAIEQGGSLKHKRLGTRNILRDLERNLARQRVSEMVTVIKAHSFSPATIAAVREAIGSDEIGLLILDADAAKQREINCYRNKLADGCWMVIDDYYGPAPDSKITPARADVDALVAAGCLEPLGFYGWSTWVGRWRRRAASVIR
jgi:L-amino acid N-acyltransferase YncA